MLYYNLVLLFSGNKVVIVCILIFKILRKTSYIEQSRDRHSPEMERTFLTDDVEKLTEQSRKLTLAGGP